MKKMNENCSSNFKDHHICEECVTNNTCVTQIRLKMQRDEGKVNRCYNSNILKKK